MYKKIPMHGKLAGFLTAVLSLVMGLGGAAAAEAAPKHLKFGCYNFSNSMDPATNVNSSWVGTRFGITECLFRFSSRIEVEPNLCDSYTVSDDYRTWTLHIRDNVFFSNGKPLTASRVKASLDRLYAATDASRGGKGNSNPESYLVYDSITADDKAGTVTVTCPTPVPNLPGILAYPYFAVIDVDEIDEKVVGTGFYYVEKDTPGVSVDMKKNPKYWNGHVPYDTVQVIYIQDSSTKAMALQRGDVDLVENITTASDVKKLSADPRFHVSTAAGVRTGNSYFNFKGVLANDDLRKAIIMALDYETMCRITVSEMYTPGISVLPSSLAYNYDKLTNPYPFNTAEAVKLLDKAGIVDTNGNGIREINGKDIRLDYLVFASRNLNDFAEAISLQLRAIGIDVHVHLIDYDTAMAMQNAGEFDLVTSNSITVGTGDPQDFLGNWYSKNSGSFGYYSSKDYDKHYEALLAEPDRVKRVELITKLQQIIINDAAAIIHGYYNSRMFSVADRVRGADISTMDYYWLTTDMAPKQ